MADLLVSALMESQKVRVVERQQLEDILGELTLQEQSFFREEGRLDRGELLNARYQIRGVITDFSQSKGGGFWVGLRNFFFKGTSYTARVALTLTLIDIQSGEIIGSALATGKAKANSAYLSAEYKGVYFGGETFSRTPLGSATHQAIKTAVQKINRSFPSTLWTPRIADSLADGRILLNGGRDRKIEPNTLYRVFGSPKVVRDPVSGDVLTRLPGEEMGRLKVVEVRDRISICEVVSGGPFPHAALLEAVLHSTN